LLEQAVVDLLLVALAVHAALGLHATPRSSYVFRNWFGGQFEASSGTRAWGNEATGYVCGPPLPALGRVHLAELFPLSLAPDGVAASPACDPNPGGRTPRAGHVLDWHAARGIRADDRRVLCAGVLLARTGSAASARWIAQSVAQLAAVPPARRATRIAEFARSLLDVRAAEERAERLERALARVRWPSILTFLLLAAALPLASAMVGLSLAWPWLLGVIAVLQAWSALAFRSAHQLLHPEAASERRLRTLGVALSPLDALRMGEQLQWGAFVDFHPFAAACAVLDDEQRRGLAVRLLRDIANPMHGPEPKDTPLSRVEAAWRAVLRRELEAATGRVGLPVELHTAPPQLEPDLRSYCPRCLQAYTIPQGRCEPCHGLPLQPLA